MIRYLQSKLVENKLVDVADKAKEAKQVKDSEVEVDLIEDTVSLELIIKTKELCGALGIHVFYYGHKASADQMMTTWENQLHYVGTIH